MSRLCSRVKWRSKQKISRASIQVARMQFSVARFTAPTTAEKGHFLDATREQNESHCRYHIICSELLENIFSGKPQSLLSLHQLKSSWWGKKIRQTSVLRRSDEFCSKLFSSSHESRCAAILKLREQSRCRCNSIFGVCSMETLSIPS